MHSLRIGLSFIKHIILTLSTLGFIFCIQLKSASAQKKDKTKSGIFSRPAQFDHRFNGAYLQWYLHDTKELVIAPGRWKKKDWLIFGGTAAATTAIVFTLDKPIHDYFKDENSDFWKTMHDVLNPFQAMTIPIYAGFVPIAYGLVTGKKRSIKVGLEVLEAQLVTSVVHYPINWIVSRERPRDGGEYTDFNWIWTKKPEDWIDVDTSFPSGHMVLAFSSAAVIAAEFHDKKWVPPAVYGLASLMGVQRMAQNAHWASDVFYGAVIGHFMTKTLIREHQKANESLKTGEPIKSSLKVFPLNYAGARGFRLVCQF